MEWYWCRQFGGVFEYFKVGIAVIVVCVLIILIYLFLTMAAFKATILRRAIRRIRTKSRKRRSSMR